MGYKKTRWPSLRSAAEYRFALQGKGTLCMRSASIDVYFSPKQLSVNSVSSSAYACLGLIVSKRCYARAVDRNRAKRIFREYARQLPCREAGFDIIFRMKKPFAPLTLPSVSAVLNTLLLQACARMELSPFIDEHFLLP